MYGVFVFLKRAGLSDAAAVPLEAVEEEAKGPNPFNLWIEFIRSSVLGINDFYKGERETNRSESTIL